jgi:HK97 family phage major capsid protein
MSSVTLAESAKLSQDLLIAGVIESVVEVNPIYEVMPFMGIEGNALAYNRENALGDVQFAGVGTTITAKNPATFTPVTASLTTIIGDAEVNGLIQATRSNINDQKAIQIASKAKSVGRQFQDTMVNGDGTSNSFEGLLALLPAGQTEEADAGAGNGGPLTFEILDELLDMIKDKDGQADFIMMPARTIRAFNALLRGLGGASINDVLTLPSGRQVPMYRGVPIFRNDWIPTDQTVGATTTCTTIFAGTFDDGSGKHGVSGISASRNFGISVKDIGESETKDEEITRVKFYCGMALFSELGIAAFTGITN